MSLIAGIWDLQASSSEPAKETFGDDTHEESVFEDNQRWLARKEDIEQGGKYQAIAKLFVRYEGQPPGDRRWAMGTGWLVEDDVLVTAGRSAFDWSQNGGKGFGRAVEVKAYIGYNGRSSVTEEALQSGETQFRHGTKIVAPNKWLESGMNRQNDISFIKLDRPFEGFQPIAYKGTPIQDTQSAIGVVGYPGDEELNGERGARMYEEFCENTWDCKDPTKNMLEYRIETYGGQSGSPVILQPNASECKPVSTGAHVDGGCGNNSGSAIEKLGNSFSEYLSIFSGQNFPEVKPQQAHEGVTYIDLNPRPEDVNNARDGPVNPSGP